MLTFDPASPFPLLASDSHTYAEAQAHSEKVDQWLGLQTEQVENDLLATDLRDGARRGTRQELWVGLPVKSMLTPYTEIRLIVESLHLLSGQTVVDLGAGYGRMAFVIGRHYPDIKFVGYEYVLERVRECERCLKAFEYPQVRMEQADLSNEQFRPIAADAYFLYDYGTREAIDKTLNDLRLIAQNRALIVIGRGRASRDAIEQSNPWLSQVFPPAHFKNYSIYRSAASC